MSAILTEETRDKRRAKVIATFYRNKIDLDTSVNFVVSFSTLLSNKGQTQTMTQYCNQQLTSENYNNLPSDSLQIVPDEHIL